MKSTEKAVTSELDEKLIEEVAKRIGGIQTHYPIEQAAVAMRGITRSPFASWIEKEENPRDFNPPMLERSKRRETR